MHHRILSEHLEGTQKNTDATNYKMRTIPTYGSVFATTWWWQIQGRAQGACPPLIFGPNWGSKGPKIFWGDCFPPSPLFSLGLDLALPEHHKLTSPLKLTRSINLSLSDLHVLLNYFVQPFLLLNTVLEAILPDYEGSRYILHSPEVWHIYCNHSMQPHEEVCFHSEEEKKENT